ncbi:HAMP domain-containing protein [Variovorax sp. PCZ-1]|uniref:HAMP domain-containing protein n=1 Tax=Variovorax sp. PCZ-1 TaxID=2835533 RepID=UPI001BCDF704|nr:HAMP domain-containing protein [Variovorax sp. PCZ-1]MBS7806231.1 HAMP domain-containing protein [Variovorax sp. PCZ-1]
MKSIRSRLVLGLGLIIVFFLAQAALVWWSQSTAKSDVVDTARKNTIASSQLTDLAVFAQQIRRYEKEYFVYVNNEERRNNYIKEWTGTSDKITKLLATMRSNADGAFSSDDVAKIGNWQSAADFYGTEMKKIFGSVNDQAGKVAQAAAAAAAAPAPTAPAAKAVAAAPAAAASAPAPVVMFAPTEVNTMITAGKDRLSGVLIKGVSEMSAEKTKQTLALSEVAAGGFNQVFAGVMLTVAIGIVIALLLMINLPKAVTKPLANLTAAVDDMSKGSLDKKIDAGNVAEFAGLATALERMRVGQQALVARMRRTS